MRVFFCVDTYSTMPGDCDSCSNDYFFKNLIVHQCC